MDNPRYVVLVMIDEPKGNAHSSGQRTAGWTAAPVVRKGSEEHTSELQSLMRSSYAVFCVKTNSRLGHYDHGLTRSHHTQHLTRRTTRSPKHAHKRPTT